MKKYIIILAFFFSLHAGFATNYYFSGNEDNNYNNPSNWTPSFPGNIIHAEDAVVLQSDVNIDGVIEINGSVEVAVGTSLFSGSNGIKIGKNGKMVNNGEVTLYFLENAGFFENQSMGILKVNTCIIRKEATLNNLFSARIASEEILNEGTFNNYSKCLTAKLSNKSDIFQFSKANMNVNNLFEKFPNSNIIPSEFAVFNAKEIKNHLDTNGSYFDMFSSRAEL
ncbi:MAG: hypothetical protein K1X92_07985 [Bacteroidia bacterium]|nr:hypothetical protein [Bacteroidia bacterium]